MTRASACIAPWTFEFSSAQLAKARITDSRELSQKL